MKKKISFGIIGILVIAIGVCIYYYNTHFTSTAILKNATNREGYSLSIEKDYVEIELFIKPEWIPFDSEKPKKLNIKLCEKNNTDIILTQVWNRGNEIYFTFDTSYHLNYRNGEFLYNAIFNEDGTFTTNNYVYDFLVYNLVDESIDLGQKGYGPSSSFSFGIQPEEYDKIRNGFHIKYSGLTLYSYSLN